MSNVININYGIIPEQKTVQSKIEKIFTVFQKSQTQIKPHFILTGASGSGKTHIIKTICDEREINFVEVNAAQLTKEGTSGNSLSKALVPIMNFGNRPGVVFVDEFDKLFISGNYNTSLAHENTNGVQNEFLKILESENTSVFGDYGKYVSVPCDNILFCFAGAFNGEENITLDRLRDFGIKTEFLGRVSQIFNVPCLSIESMQIALESLKTLDDYLDLFIDVRKEKVVHDIMDYVRKAHATNTLGVRLLTSLVNQYFLNGGSLEEQEVTKTTFQGKLNLTD